MVTDLEPHFAAVAPPRAMIIEPSPASTAQSGAVSLERVKGLGRAAARDPKARAVVAALIGDLRFDRLHVAQAHSSSRTASCACAIRYDAARTRGG